MSNTQRLASEVDEVFRGLTLLGVKAGVDAIELVFDAPNRNLLSIYTGDPLVNIGFVDDPTAYAK